MKLETMREQVRSVAKRWRTYGNDKWGADKQDIQRKLDGIDVETATAKEVAKIIGSGLWVGPPRCNECGVKTWSAIELGETPDYASNTAMICIDCLRKAVVLVESGAI